MQEIDQVHPQAKNLHNGAVGTMRIGYRVLLPTVFSRSSWLLWHSRYQMSGLNW
jgi:hypothetical protein